MPDPLSVLVQDLFVVMSDSADSTDDPLTFITALERQADTISPVVRVPFYDDTIARVKADALLCVPLELIALVLAWLAMSALTLQPTGHISAPAVAHAHTPACDRDYAFSQLRRGFLFLVPFRGHHVCKCGCGSGFLQIDRAFAG